MGMLRFARFYKWLLGHGNTRKYTEEQNLKNFLPRNPRKNTKKQELKSFCHGSTRKDTELIPKGIYFSVFFRVIPWQLFFYPGLS